MFHRLLHEVPVAEDHQVIDDEDTEDEREMTVPAEPPSPGQDCNRMTLPVMAEKDQEDRHIPENLHSVCWNKCEMTYRTVFCVSSLNSPRLSKVPAS